MIKKSWYSPGEITFQKDEILFILDNLGDIRIGFWPPEHKETGYVGMSKHRPAGAYFEKAIQIGAEVVVRLIKCRRDGKMVYDHYYLKEDIVDIAEFNQLDYWYTVECIDSALRYITGWKRKSTDYIAWKKKTRQRVRQ